MTLAAFAERYIKSEQPIPLDLAARLIAAGWIIDELKETTVERSTD